LAKARDTNVRKISGIFSQQLGNHLAVLRESLDGSLETDLGSRGDKDFTGSARFHGLRVLTMMMLVVSMFGNNKTQDNGNKNTTKTSLHIFLFYYIFFF
jgi:hypothetical protein